MLQESYTALPGTAVKPGYCFLGNETTGIFYDQANSRIAFVVAGAIVATINASGIQATTFEQPVATRPAGWAITSFTEDKAFPGNSTTAADAVKAVASLVNDLIAVGIIDGSVAA